jgi:Predicted membrane protein (DUF2207)
VNAIRRLPAVILVLVLGLLPLQAWLRAGRPDVRYSQPLAGLDGITWTGTVSQDGQLSVTIVYDFGDDQVRQSDIRLPSGARFVSADGSPIVTTSGRYGTAESHDVLTVTYERVGAVTRYPDGVIVDFAGIDSSDNRLFPCARCYLDIDGYGNTSITGALFADDLTDARIALSSVDQLRAGDDDGALRFVGVVPGADDAGMIAWLPVAAAPDAPTESSVPEAVTGESAAQVWDATRAASDDPLAEADSGPPIGRIAAAVLLTAMWVLLVAWIAVRVVSAARALAEDRPDHPMDRDAAFSPPSDLEPALVAVVVGDSGPGDRSAVAATLLMLAQRGVVRIDGIDSERYTLTIPAGARGATAFEEAVLEELRPQGKLTATATLTGPPLWGDSGASISRRFTGTAVKEAKQARLVRVTLTAWVLMPASLAMGIVALIASGGTSLLAWVVTFVGPLLALVATVLTGVNLTAKGRAERDHWLDYGEWLRTNSQLDVVGAPGVATWGEPLAYAAVLGAAPKAAKALGLG